MGMRGGAARRMVDNPLGGMLRDLDRRTRSTTRRRGPAPPGGQPAAGPASPAVRRGTLTVAAVAVVVTGADGRARWQWPRTFSRPPVVAALPAGDGPVLAVVESVSTTGAVVRVWALDGEPAGPGVAVHIQATEAPAP